METLCVYSMAVLNAVCALYYCMMETLCAYLITVCFERCV
jgi:hypothetical protein